mmetsp:Transcript_13859/g.16135  ORF Transcript_13859/g.16135 Transcript_13859/m.16135 type:complete len:156 (+) Transcript_13859:51-518(+)
MKDSHNCSHTAIITQREPTSSTSTEAGAALLLTATSLDECKDLFQQQACTTHPSAGGSLQEFNMTLQTFSSLCNGFATTGQLQWLPEAESWDGLSDLQGLLGRLSPLRRREAIQRLPQKERHRLERWMLRKSRSVEKDHGRSTGRRGVLSERSLR